MNKCPRCGENLIEITTYYQGYTKYEVMCTNAILHDIADCWNKIKEYFSWTKK